MSAEATGWTWKHSPYRGPYLLVHLAIADVVNDVHDNEFWMSTGNLAEKAKVSRATVVRFFTDAVSQGLLEVVVSGQRTRTPTLYRFQMTSASQSLARSGRSLSSLSEPSDLGADRATELKEPNEHNQRAGSLKVKADPSCVTCRGEGSYYNGMAGFEMSCDCTLTGVSVVPDEAAEA